MHLLQTDFSLFLLLALGYTTEVLGLEVSDRIFGGYETDSNKFPYTVEVMIRYHVNNEDRVTSSCTGAIISENFVLTAALCVAQTHPDYGPIKAEHIWISDNRSPHGVLFGPKFNVKNLVIHPDANVAPEAVSNCSAVGTDVAILELAEPLPLGPGIQAIPLPTEDTIVPEGTKATISGFGAVFEFTNRDGLLRAAEVTIAADDVCRKYFGSTVPERKICAGAAGAGQPKTAGIRYADTGAPLVVNGILEGIASCSGSNTCPDVYARVANSEIRAFIKKVAGI